MTKTQLSPGNMTNPVVRNGAKLAALSSRVAGQKAAAKAVNTLAKTCHLNSIAGGWWHHPETGEPLERNEGELISLMHSELSEALEGLRKNIMDKHLTHRESVEVELGDAVIRILDYAASQKMDIGGAIFDKLEYNAKREDHKPENRAKKHGKSF